MKKLLFLGASDTQVYAIQRAVELGFHVTTCDYRPENPGHRVAHDSYNVSTTDHEGVLELAQRLKVDSILAYGSDPGALTAALVADRLGLPGDPPEAVILAQDKLRLRSAQRDAGLPVPEFVDASDGDALADLTSRSATGVVVKPVDSSGGRGISFLTPRATHEDRWRCVAHARAHSQSGRIIGESMWGPGLPQFAGNTIVVGGRVQHLAIGDQVMPRVLGAATNIGNIAPTNLADSAVTAMRSQTQRLVSALGLSGGVYDLEYRFDREGELTIVDFGARAGGYLVGLRYHLAYGIDYPAAAILIAAGYPIDTQLSVHEPKFAGLFVIHSETSGTLREIRLDDRVKKMTHELLISAQPGSKVRPFRTSADRLGVIVMVSRDRSALEAVYGDPHSFVRVVVDDSDGFEG